MLKAVLEILAIYKGRYTLKVRVLVSLHLVIKMSLFDKIYDVAEIDVFK